jgi:hypothetical protein
VSFLAYSLSWLIFFLLLSGVSDARVKRFIIENLILLANGRNWGRSGAYERLRGRADLEVDPTDPLSTVVFNLEKAPRNSRGLVEFSTPFLILKPVNMARGNHKIWFGVNNRGNCIELGFSAFPITRFPVTREDNNCNPVSVDDIGSDNFLLNEGYVFVDAGWQADGIPDGRGKQLFPNFPLASEPDGATIVGPLRLEYQTDTATFTWPLPDPPAGVRVWRPYEAADTNTAHANLTVRDREDAARVSIAPSRWAFGRCTAGQANLTPTTTDIRLFDGFAAGKIYEVVYTAKDPIVMGLAYVVPRDIGSFLRYAKLDDSGHPNPLATAGSATGIRRAYSSGTSSTGMYEREFLYLGFNEDEMHRKVFDGVTIYAAGSYRLFANLQFAHPTYFSMESSHHDFTSNSITPMTFAVTKDPITGITDGLLKRPRTDPLVIQIDGEFEFWQWKASLNVVDGAGKPVRIPYNVRLYFQDGFQHIGATGLLSPQQPLATCQDSNGMFAAAPVTLRALVRVMDDWADHGIKPPNSNYPSKHDLATAQEYHAVFPAIPGIDSPTSMNELTVFNFGPSFRSQGGNETILPPVAGRNYQVFVPKPSADGSARSGIHTIYTRAPLGTNVGWTADTVLETGRKCEASFFPLSTTKAARLAIGDSRQSLQERYTDHDGFVFAVAKAAKQLVKERFTLDEDAVRFIEATNKSAILK